MSEFFTGEYFRIGKYRDKFYRYIDGEKKALMWWNDLEEDHRMFMTKNWYGKRRIKLRPEEVERIYTVFRWRHSMPEKYC